MPPKFYKQSLPNLQIADSSYFIQMIQSLEIEKSTTHFMKCITLILKLAKNCMGGGELLTNPTINIDIKILHKILAK